MAPCFTIVIFGTIRCILDRNLVTVLFPFEEIQKNINFNKTFSPSDSNWYSVVYVNCILDIQVSMNAKTTMYNIKGDSNF